MKKKTLLKNVVPKRFVFFTARSPRPPAFSLSDTAKIPSGIAVSLSTITELPSGIAILPSGITKIPTALAKIPVAVRFAIDRPRYFTERYHENTDRLRSFHLALSPKNTGVSTLTTGSNLPAVMSDRLGASF